LEDSPQVRKGKKNQRWKSHSNSHSNLYRKRRKKNVLSYVKGLAKEKILEAVGIKKLDCQEDQGIKFERVLSDRSVGDPF